LSETKEWNAGEHLMTPLHGVCEVVERMRQEILGQTQAFYVLRPLDESGTLKLPARSLDAGVRPLLEKRTMEDMLHASLDDVEIPQLRPHQRMDLWYTGLKAADPLARRRILWQMMQVRQRERKLSPAEEQLCGRVKQALLREMRLVLDLDEPGAETLLDESLHFVPA